MIIDGLVRVLVALLKTILDAALPVGGPLGLVIPSGLLSGYSWLDAMAPLHEMVTGAGIILGVTAAVFVVRLVLTIWAAVPGKFS